jgi:peptidoglycan LD-endopeptidase LytH
MHLPSFIFALLGGLAWTPLAVAGPMVWPTPHPGPAEGGAFEEWAQPTVSGNPVSALFGCVRNGGNRFHEGIDVTPFLPRENGEATDDIYASWAGTVVYVNEVARTSGYGLYVVVKHEQFAPAFVTLYAHLATIAPGIRAGVKVGAGDVLGRMGRSAGGYHIPPERAHLHFEIALRLSDDFQAWYDALEYDTKNEHGIWNGLNLIGLDPYAAWQWMREAPEERTLPDFIRTLPVGFIAEVTTDRVPDIVERYPALLDAPLPAAGVRGWAVAVSGWGMPLRFTPLAEAPAGRRGTVGVVAVDPTELERWTCRGLVEYERGVARLSHRGGLLFRLLFGFTE